MSKTYRFRSSNKEKRKVDHLMRCYLSRGYSEEEAYELAWRNLNRKLRRYEEY